MNAIIRLLERKSSVFAFIKIFDHRINNVNNFFFPYFSKLSLVEKEKKIVSIDKKSFEPNLLPKKTLNTIQRMIDFINI